MKFSTYPYTTARIMVMKSELLERDDYIRMRSMGIHEIIRFLEEHQYKKEIIRLSKYFRGMELINLALNVNLAGTVNKLLKISIDEEVRQVVQMYANKWVVNNLKIVVRVKMNGLGKEHIRYGIISVEPTTYSVCRALHKAEPEAMAWEIKKMTGVEADALLGWYQAGDLASIENALDMAYYRKLLDASKAMPVPMLRDFMRNLVELTNIRNVVKLKTAGVDKRTAEQFLVAEKKDVVARLLEAEDIVKMGEVLKASRYASLAENIESNPANLENNIEKFLLQYAFKLLHVKPTSVAPIFGYLLAKEIEIRNLRLVINAKVSGLENEFIERNLIVAA